MSGFEVDAEELRAAAASLRSFASYPPKRVVTVTELDIHSIRNTAATNMISSLVEKANDNITDLVTVILALGDGLEKAASNYGLADVWGGE